MVDRRGVKAMCEFMRVNPNNKVKSDLPMCDYTKELCTFCILGNSNTYNKAKECECGERKTNE